MRDGFILQLDARLVGIFGWEEMPPLSMSTGHKPHSPDPMSPEESQVSTPGSDREGEGRQTGPRGVKRKDNNRNAASKSRRKHTDRADELHEELQHLERSNSAFQKEIADLKKNLHLYQTALVHHEPRCRLRDAASISPSAVCQAGSSPPQASTSSQISPDSLSSCFTPGLSRQSLDCVESPHLSPSTSTLDSSICSSSDTFTSSSSATLPYSVSSSALPVSHPLRRGDPPLSVTSRPTNVSPLCTSSQSQSGQGAVHDCSSVSANACFSPMSDFLIEQESFFLALSNTLPPYPHVASENTGLIAQGSPMNGPQFHPGHFRGNPVNSNMPISGVPTTLQDPVLQFLSMSPQVNPELSHSQDIVPSPVSLLSQLTIPSPLDLSTITSSTLDGLQHQPLTSLPAPSENTSGDLSFSEFLEDNEWILLELGFAASSISCNIAEKDKFS